MIGLMPRRMTSPVLVGRTDAVDQLLAVLAAARAGRPRHALVAGEAGVGKTRLLARLRELAEGEGARVLTGGCVSLGDAGLPFAPYTEILRALVAQEGAAGLAALAGRASHDLARLVPALAPDSTPPSQELWAQTRLFEALLDLLRRLADRSPLVVQLEDLHWADAGTLAATTFLLRAITDEPIVVVATYRLDEVVRTHPLRPWLAEASRSEGVERLELGPLDDADVAELVHNITGEQPSTRFVTELARRSDGNPFFVEELLCCQTVLEGPLPSSLRDVLLTRVDVLEAPARHLLGVAATGGREVSHELLLAVAGGSERESGETLRTLVDAGLLVPSAMPTGDGYAFRHALLQEAVYEATLPTERRHLHAEYAELLERRDRSASEGASHLVELAHHWREARDERALAASIRAGEAAGEGFAFDIALREYEHALRLWPVNGQVAVEGVDHVELLARTARAAYLSSRYRTAVAACREALVELGEDTDPERHSSLLVQLGRVLWVDGDYTASVDAYEEALRIAPEESPMARIRALAGLGQIYMLFGWYSRSAPLCEEVIALARAEGAREWEGHALNTLGTSLAALGQGEAAMAAMDAAMAIAVELGLPDDIGRAHVNRGDILAYGGDPAGALAATQEGIRHVMELGMETSYGAYLRYGGVHFAYEAGAWDTAAELLRAGDRQAPEGTGTQLYRALYVLPYLVGSGAAEAAQTWELARRGYVASPPTAQAAAVYMAGVELAAFEGRFDEAREWVREGLDLVASTDHGRYVSDLVRVAAWPVAEACISARARGARDEEGAAEATLARLSSVAAEARAALGGAGEVLRRILALNESQVALELARVAEQPSGSDWRVLAEGWDEVGHPYAAAYARWREADARDRAGRREAAVAALRAAHAITARLGARPLETQLEILARRMRVRLAGRAEGSPGAPRESAFGLTPREREVLARVAAGRTNRQIAEELFISESTAGVHVSNILAKLGVSSRTEAAGLALSQGLADA
jgi:DNA-binding CsgD family transcriptional regulator/tetratricopeptide (TPR) repeat protein